MEGRILSKRNRSALGSGVMSGGGGGGGEREDFIKSIKADSRFRFRYCDWF